MSYRIGLTGGIGCGKSTVAARFAAHGIPIIDSDRIARELVEPGQPALAAITQAFGADLLHADGRLDRRALRLRIFGDAGARSRLEAILHPRIRATMQAASAQTEAPYIMLMIPLLIESGWQDMVDRILVIDCAPETQIRRVMARDKASEPEVRAILAAQASREGRLSAAHDILRNEDADTDTLDARIAELDMRYREAARADRT
ncbi:dephospho-CoA kinase [Acidihalobacter yilgarnensis]|uniref:Dephospho-CoA kinase n=1 Tax=Acidihalobacter yilgarnensis TaxID=2819280 RepID=A0A1D8IRI1_9GAMM|nr:dephospho-CoA kinase [Acidihalobacter yilgarnensis]AOU98995.1 dephospho-CoA kinase [Acidihalobacter yilgarnensis]